MGITQSVDARKVFASAIEKSLPTSDNYFIQKLNRWAIESNSNGVPAIELVEESDDDVQIIAVDPPPSPICSTTTSSSSSNEASFTSPHRKSKMTSKLRDRSHMSPYYRDSRRSLSKNLYFEMLCRNLPSYRSSKTSFKKVHPKRMEAEIQHRSEPLSKYNYLEYTTQKSRLSSVDDILRDPVTKQTSNNNDKWFASFRKELLELEKERERDITAKEKEIEEILKKRSFLRETRPTEIVTDPQSPPLNDAMKSEIQAAFRSPTSKILINAFKLDITRTDLDTLKGLTWLNDTVINFYLNMIVARSQKGGLPKVYAYNTFFYTRLSKEGHKAVRRWTRRDDIFSYDILLVPIHLGMHWCLSVIDFRKKFVDYYDSMGGDNNRCLSSLLQYLEDEKRDKKNEIFDRSDWDCRNLKDLPQQGNGSDCGVFACKYADYVSRDAKINFTQKDMPYFRQRMVYEILKGELL